MNKLLLWFLFVGMWNLIMFLVNAAQQGYGYSAMSFAAAALMFTFAHFELQNIFRRDEEKQK